jgi:hypothetical protein
MENILIADEGMIYTDDNGVYGYKIFLGEGRNANEFRQITVEEYEENMRIEMERVLSDNLAPIFNV